MNIRSIFLIIIFSVSLFLKATATTQDSLKMLMDLLQSMPPTFGARAGMKYEMVFDKVSKEVKIIESSFEKTKKDNSTYYITSFIISDINPNFILINPPAESKNFFIQFFTIHNDSKVRTDVYVLSTAVSVKQKTIHVCLKKPFVQPAQYHRKPPNISIY